MKHWIALVLCLLMASCASLPKPEVRPMNVNSASRARLEQLPGIGPATAQRIIEGRPYTSPEGLLNIKGVDYEVLKKIKPLITTGEQ